MPGTIIGAVMKKRIADCHIKSISYVTDREGLLSIYQAARYALVKGEHFDRVVKALSERATELGINKKKGI